MQDPKREKQFHVWQYSASSIDRLLEFTHSLWFLMSLAVHITQPGAWLCPADMFTLLDRRLYQWVTKVLIYGSSFGAKSFSSPVSNVNEFPIGSWNLKASVWETVENVTLCLVNNFLHGRVETCRKLASISQCSVASSVANLWGFKKIAGEMPLNRWFG